MVPRGSADGNGEHTTKGMKMNLHLRTLTRQTLRTLTKDELRLVAGGGARRTLRCEY